MTRIAALVAVGGTALALSASAWAHVTVDPGEAAADSFARFAIRVPNERPTAATVKLTIRLPAGLTFVGFQSKPGWKRTVTMAKLAQPVTIEGERVTERIATVTWSGGSIGPGEFDEFGMSAHVPKRPGSALVFPALQTYDNGETVRWIGGPDADEPAPRVTLTASEESSEQPAAAAVESPSADDEEDDRDGLTLGLAIVGLVVGLIALGAALIRKGLFGWRA